eukprot:1180877-Prorocentrum_minimum.AAC.2
MKFPSTRSVAAWMLSTQSKVYEGFSCGDGACNEPYEFPGYAHLGCRVGLHVATKPLKYGLRRGAVAVPGGGGAEGRLIALPAGPVLRIAADVHGDMEPVQAGRRPHHRALGTRVLVYYGSDLPGPARGRDPQVPPTGGRMVRATKLGLRLGP